MIERTQRGTEVTLHLRDGEDEFLSNWKLRSIIRKYSDHITLPIVMKKEEWNDEKKEQVQTDEDETVNQASALWTRPKSEISDEQYKEFYKHVAHDFDDPLAHVHARVEGKRARRGEAGIYAIALHSVESALRPVRPDSGQPATASSSTCGAFSSWTMPSN